MTSLLLSTLAMMGLTFLIGFFVAAVIKLIAYAADSFDFYSSHRLELLRLRRWQQHRQKVERLIRQLPSVEEENFMGDTREDFSRGINRNFTGYSGYYHGVSPGASEENLMDYYYPRDTHDLYLQEEERAHVNKKNTKKSTTNK
ncbi:LapA family protein [Bacteroides sp.]|uniref:LapA family protein n=1 Tax=Bacteroides sp. TaxID=29523 RepID=UPI0026018C68|nr:LapA family protein [Bacteroides sp.]MDD3036728.1 LapA family protein [Bacteroides sp.]